MKMPAQEKFEYDAKRIFDKNQAEMNLKFYQSHWTGYKEVKNRHKNELRELAEIYGVEVDLKKWRLREHWMSLFLSPPP